MSSNLQQRRPIAAPSSSTPNTTLAPNTGPSDTTPLVAPGVIRTLLLFTAAMVVCPIGSYFLTVNTIFRGNSTFAGGFAAFMANVVLIGYIVVAWQEDAGDEKGKTGVTGAEDAKKDK